MKKLVFLSILLICISCSFVKQTEPSFQNGDVIFQTSKSQQSGFIQRMTNSKLTHVGIIYIKNDQKYVLEAVSPVKITRLENWINRGVNKDYILMRPKNPLSKEQLNKMYKYGLSNLNKPYDMKFQWSDKKMYCSELVYKIYEHGGLVLCDKKTFSEYNLNGEETKKEITSRYGSLNIDENEVIVSPYDLYKSNKLRVVTDTY